MTTRFGDEIAVAVRMLTIAAGGITSEAIDELHETVATAPVEVNRPGLAVTIAAIAGIVFENVDVRVVEEVLRDARVRYMRGVE